MVSGDNCSYKSCKAPVKSSPPTNQHPVFLQAGCPYCHPNNNVKALKGKISHSMDLLTPSSPGGLPTLSLTTNSSWFPWRRVTMPLISPLMPVPHCGGICTGDNRLYSQPSTTVTSVCANYRPPMITSHLHTVLSSGFTPSHCLLCHILFLSAFPSVL